MQSKVVTVLLSFKATLDFDEKIFLNLQTANKLNRYLGTAHFAWEYYFFSEQDHLKGDLLSWWLKRPQGKWKGTSVRPSWL